MISKKTAKGMAIGALEVYRNQCEEDSRAAFQAYFRTDNEDTRHHAVVLKKAARDAQRAIDLLRIEIELMDD